MIIADRTRLELTPWNKAYGNKILHLLFVTYLCHSHRRKLILPCPTDLREFFELDPYVHPELVPRKLRCALNERSAFPEYGKLESGLRRLGIHLRRHSLNDSIRLSREQYEQELAFLKGPLPSGPFFVAGHFWHTDLMPGFDVFQKYMRLNPRTVESVRSRYPTLTNPQSVAIHYRGTDYAWHLKEIFPKSIMLDSEYYLRAIELAEKSLEGPLTFHLFSDSPEALADVLAGRNLVVHRDPAAWDWIGIHLCPNVIQSNSTFCWTASLYNKEFSVQPAGGCNYWEDSGDIPFGFRMKFSHTINFRGELKFPESNVAGGTRSSPN
jgi:hypothetical protein